MPERFYQTVLNLPARPLTGRGDFLVTSSNAEAVGMIDSLPNGFSGAIIYGENGSGKTHMSHLFAEAVRLKEQKKTVFAEAASLSVDILEHWLKESPFLVLENVRAPVDERALFHLINSIKGMGGFLFMTSEMPPLQWNLALPDLITRLKAMPCVAITAPDEMLMRAVLVKQFADRQLSVAPEVIEYLLKNMERSFSAAAFVTKQADELSLAEKRPVTIPLVKQVLAELDGGG